jgi:hypothetical protein
MEPISRILKVRFWRTVASFRRRERMTACHPLLKFKLGHYPPSVVSLIHCAAAHRFGRASSQEPILSAAVNLFDRQ